MPLLDVQHCALLGITPPCSAHPFTPVRLPLGHPPAGAYRDAYVSLSAPALFAPFVRLELLKWRPLHGGEAGESMVP